MDRQNIITIVAVVAVVIAGLLWLKPFSGGGDQHGDNNANLPDGAWYQCSDLAAPHEFNLTVKQLDAHYQTNYGKEEMRPPCPTCGKPGNRASKCASCGKLTLQTSSLDKCGHCGAPYTKP